MALLLLPLEVLTQIIEETMPEGFVGIISTCKTVYHASGNLREKHNRLSRHYRDFNYTFEHHQDFSWHILSSLHLLSKIADEPLIARYIVSANFTLDRIPSGNTIQAHINHIKDSSNLLSLLERSPYLRSTGIDPRSVLEYLISEYVADEVDSGLAPTLLLTLLPNVIELSLPAGWNSFNQNLPDNIPCPISSWLNDIVTRANDPCDSSAGLSRLTTLLPSSRYHDHNENNWALSIYTPFLFIKTVENFFSGGCMVIDDNYTGIPFPDPRWESFGAGLEVAGLFGAYFDGGKLQKFLSRLPKLRSLGLSYMTEWYDTGHVMDARAIMEAVEDAAGGTLELLSFTAYNFDGKIKRGVQSMKGFTKLTELELDMELLLSREGGEPDDSGEDEGGSKVPRLGDLLPPTIEWMCLRIYNDSPSSLRDLACLFSEVAIDKDEKLPNLNKIEIRYDNFQLAEPGLSSNAPSETSLWKGSTTDCSIPQWQAELASLASSVDIEYVSLRKRASLFYTRPFFQTCLDKRLLAES
ncbi:uncharacterized protein BP5553_06384 [Venustampulla echinocandica]|uniref:F-box domain-containing protein n=1 Tax=Venustampulla echinocandica TaxID=2656787 RepID=A0A370TJS0_9HELO|nr:uncharacterized protein BP5553_06384 [Venustampulla echinocandica]RDL35772.1 hypothetical protein BP5553_06384 [Venustampulla echinocandica]